MVRAILRVRLALTFFLLLVALPRLASFLPLRILALSTISFTIVSAKLRISVLFMLRLNLSLRAVVLSSLLAAALFLSPVSVYADFRSDFSFVSDSSVREVYSYNDLASGAAIDGALGALGVKLALGTGALLTTKDLIDSVINGSPLGVVNYQYQGKFYDLVDQSTIRIRDDVVTIDGVDYKDIWLPHDAAVKFRVNAFDFITYHNLVSESSGIYASGVGFTDTGIPIYQTADGLSSQLVTVPSDNDTYDVLGFRAVVLSQDSSRKNYHVYDSSGNSVFGSDYTPMTDFPIVYRIFSPNISLELLRLEYKPSYHSQFVANSHGLGRVSYTSQPFDFTWVSSTIPAEALPDDDGLRFRIPSSYVSGLPSVISPDLSQYSDFLEAIGNAIEQARLANAVESTAFEEYDSPAPPVPSHGNIAEEPYSSLDNSLSGLQDSLDNIDTNIGTVDESLDDIKVYTQDASDSLQSIDTNLSQSVADTAGIKGTVQTYFPIFRQFFNNISSSVSNIAGSVAAADQTFFGNVVDAILVPFTPIINVFKAGMGIWRYVVAWVGNISAPFTWSLSSLSGAGSIFVSPIYASAAAAVVLAVYKKFGR